MGGTEAHFAAEGLERAVGDRVLFRGLSFELAEGDTLAVLAPSGSGKTLLLRLLAGLDPLPAGIVRLDGRRQEDWPMPEWRSRVVYCPQRPPAMGGSPADVAAEVAGWGTREDRPGDDPEELAREWGVAGVWDEPWRKLSGGEAQRAALAIAVATRPAVLLLDEPTSALDEAARERVEERLGTFTSVWVTHDEEQAERVAGRRLRLLDLRPAGQAPPTKAGQAGPDPAAPDRATSDPEPSAPSTSEPA